MILIDLFWWTFTVVLGLTLLAGVFKICRDLVRRYPISLYFWSIMAQVAFFFADGLVLLAAHGHQTPASQLLLIAGFIAAWPRVWKDWKEREAKRVKAKHEQRHA